MMSENGGDAVGDSLRENMQMEKLKALRPMNVDAAPQQTRKPAAGRADTKEVAKDIQVRPGGNPGANRWFL